MIILKKQIDIAKAIGELYDTTKKADALCTEVPTFSVKLGSQMPMASLKSPRVPNRRRGRAWASP
jgi:hypothetical protein